MRAGGWVFDLTTENNYEGSQQKERETSTDRFGEPFPRGTTCCMPSAELFVDILIP